MEETIVKAQVRDTSVKPKQVRLDGNIPAVLYANGKDAVAVQVEYQEFRKAYRKTGDSTVMYVDLDGKKIPTLIHDMQYNPVYDDYTHIDFYQVNEKKVVTAHLPIILEGLAPAVKTLNGVLVQPTKSIEISCLPKFLLHDITVEVTGLTKFHDSITVAELPVSQDKNITIITAPETVVASISTPKGGGEGEEEETPTEESTDESKSEEKKD